MRRAQITFVFIKYKIKSSFLPSSFSSSESRKPVRRLVDADDEGDKKTYMKFPSFDETKMPTEAAEENVVEIEALGTATLRRD